jgi:hypothetical protein
MSQTKEQLLKELDHLSAVIYNKATTTGAEHTQCLQTIINLKRFVEAQFTVEPSPPSNTVHSATTDEVLLSE